METAPAGVAFSVELTKAVGLAMIARGLYPSLAQGVEAGKATLVDGTVADAEAFFALFDEPSGERITLANR